MINARDFAARKHINQAYGTFFYTYHLDNVVHNLWYFGYTSQFYETLGYLHDVLEDTDCTYDELVNEFGIKIANTVQALTNEPGKNRKERFAKTYPKIRADQSARIVKLADRISNWEFSLLTRSKLASMYKKEYTKFRYQLYDKNDPQEVLEMWTYLNHLFEKEIKHG